MIFPTQLLGTTSVPQLVVVKSTATTTLTISNIAITGTNSSDFAISSKTCRGSLAGGASCEVNVVFHAKTIDTRTANLSVSDNRGGSPQQVSLSGTGTVVKLVPNRLFFGDVAVGSRSTKTVTLTNTGQNALSITAAITGAAAADY